MFTLPSRFSLFISRYLLICFTNIVFAAKYDVAISTACPGLDYIVVETSGAAQACVELLRKENLGVATFMILVLHAYHSYVQNFILLRDNWSHPLFTLEE